MNKFDRAVNKKARELIAKNLPGQNVDEEALKKFQTIARALIREEQRGVKPKNHADSLYQKTWKAASKYGEFQK
ncbi:MAG: hypothetical protein AB6733_04625 [Clostridiaceae bacterium]